MNGAPDVIGLTGASGQLGRMVLRALTSQQDSYRHIVACTRNPHALGSEVGAAEVREADFGQPDTLVTAFTGIDRLLVIAIEGPDDRRVQMHADAVRAATAAGVQHIVYAGFLDVDPGSPSTVAQIHRRTEDIVRASSSSWTMLRNGPYLENTVARIVAAAHEDDSTFRWSGGDARLPFIGREDLATAAACALLHPEAGAVFRLTGPEQLGFGELCALVSAKIGRTVRYESLSDEAFAAECRTQGLGDDYVDRRVAYGRAMREGFMSAHSTDFRTLVGRDPVQASEVIAALDLS